MAGPDRRGGTLGGAVTVLAIETATDMVGAALVRDDGASAERIHFGGRAHAELLVPIIEEVCAVSGCTVADVDTIAVDVGPGLFTGLRVGVATAKALAQALDVGIVGALSLDVLAAAAVGPPAAVAAVVDARRGEVFASVFRFDRNGPWDPDRPVDPMAVRDDRDAPMAPEDLVEWLVSVAEDAGPVTVVGDGAVRYHHLLAEHDGLDLSQSAAIASPPPLALAGLALRRLSAGMIPAPAAEVVPDYRRPADARINWEQRPPGSTAPAEPTGR